MSDDTKTERPTPKPGDVMLGCEHRPSPYGAHIFQTPGGSSFVRPDGTRGIATWIAICNECHMKYVVEQGGSVRDVPLGCDMTWGAGAASLKFQDPS